MNPIINPFIHVAISIIALLLLGTETNIPIKYGTHVINELTPKTLNILRICPGFIFQKFQTYQYLESMIIWNHYPSQYEYYLYHQ